LVDGEERRTVADVLVDLGPVPSASASAWADYARGVLASPVAADLPDAVREGFELFLREVEQQARATAEFRWSTQTTHEQVAFVVHAFHRLVVRLNADEDLRRSHELPELARPFYRLLVSSLLGALAGECAASAAFAEQLASFWPGLDPAELLTPVSPSPARLAGRR